MANDIEFIKLSVQEKIGLIAAKLLEQDPMLPVHLSHIHAAMIQYEELVHLLKPEEIRNLIAGQMRHTNVQVVKEISKQSKATVSKRIPKTTVDDL